MSSPVTTVTTWGDTEGGALSVQRLQVELTREFGPARALRVVEAPPYDGLPSRPLMARQRPPREHIDADGVRTTTSSGVRPGVWLLLVGVGVLAIAVVLGRRSSVGVRSDEEVGVRSHQAEDTGTAASRRARASGGSGFGRPQQQPAVPVELPPAADAGADHPATSEAATEADAVTGDEPSGIAVFPPPGTDPIKSGIMVPDDFELPSGYVRHYQVTDDGKRLPAILMFHPDYEPVDEHGEPIPLPPDLVVPPDMAPPGLPVRILEVPDDTVPMLEGPEDAGKDEPAP